MTQNECWLAKYNEVMAFVEINHCKPSKHRIEGPLMLNWLKHNHKLLNAGKMKTDRVEKFKELLALSEKYRRKNQYE